MHAMQEPGGQRARIDQLGIRPPDAYTVRRGAAPDGVVVEVDGELDLGAAPALDRHLGAAREERPRAVVLDMTAVRFVDSSALRALLRARQAMADDGVALVLAGVAPQVERLFELTGTDGLLPMAPRVADALERV
jgi:anti-sigma B factor antagonist